MAALLCGLTGNAWSADYGYAGVVTLCTGTCASFASLDSGSKINGTIEINTVVSGSFSLADVGDYSFEILNPGAPLEPYDGTNPTTANPLPIDPATTQVVASGFGLTTGGTTDSSGELNSGTILPEFIIAPFNNTGHG